MRELVVNTNRRSCLTLAKCASGRRRSRRAIARRLIWAVMSAQLSWMSGAAAAEDVTKEQMQGLDQQVQEIKSDALSIASELDRLEEKLLYPSNTQVAIFVSLAEGDSVQLDSVEIQIDGDPVARHIYSFKELEALKKGGVQRIYTGNVPTGEHRLEVSMSGKAAGGKDVSASERFNLSKDVEPKLVGITLAGGTSGAASIRLGGW